MSAKVVTIGGGHGQAALVRALVRLECELTALVSVTDDGGCSGLLRAEMGMPPPGDIRRCLLAQSTRPKLAARFDERLPDDLNDAARSAGNLVLAEMFQRLSGLQRAVDWAALLLGCVGRVVPLAETAGVLRAYDQAKGALEGETNIEKQSVSTIVVNVEGPEHANIEATSALADADLVFIGPGSFVGSTLAALMTGDVASAVVRVPRRILVHNLGSEPGAMYGVDQHERIVLDHLLIKNGGSATTVDALSHSDAPEHSVQPRSDGSLEYRSCLRRGEETTHDEDLLARALSFHFELPPAPPHPPSTETEEAEAHALFDKTLEAAMHRLRSRE